MDIILKAGEDDELSLPQIGIIVRFHHHGPIAVTEAEKWYAAEDIDRLLLREYLERNEEKVRLVGTVSDEAEIWALWLAFYVPYPGPKRDKRNDGKVEFQALKNKWRPGNKWRKILPTLPTELARQIEERRILTEYKQRLEMSGRKSEARNILIPAWKHMETYLGNKCGWTDSLPMPAVLSDGPPARQHEPEVEGASDSYTLYKKWVLDEGKAAGMAEMWLGAITPLRSEYEGMIGGTATPFINRAVYVTEKSLKESIGRWTREYFSNALARSAYKDLMDHYKAQYTKIYLTKD